MTHNKKVIELKVAGQGSDAWTFYDFVYLNESNPIEDWYRKDLSDEGQLLFMNSLKDCSKIDNPRHWPAFKRFLSGGEYRKHRIWELHFYADRRQYRVLGVFGGKRKQAILLVGCYHKQRVYAPTDALETALKRAKGLAEGRAKLCERKIQTDQ